MKKLTLFLSLLMVMLLSVGQVWATDFTLSSAAEVTKDGITVTFAKGDGSNPPAWYSAGLRLYVKNTVTITSTSNITAISFNWEKQGSKTFNTSCTASTGSYTHPSSAGVGTWTGSATSVTFTLGNVSGAQLQLNTFSVTTEGGGSSDPTLTVEPATIDFGTVDQNAVVASKTVAVTFANLTGSVTYSGLSGAFSASGSISATGDEITIAANTSTVGEYKQTLTVTSADDSKSAEVTVKMNVVEPFDGLKLTFDVSSNPGEWPTTNDASLTNYTYALNAVDYTFALKNIKCNSGYLMMTATAVLGLPAIEGYKLEKVEATNSSSCSTTTQVKITSDEAGDEVVSGGAAQTFSTTSTKYTYTLSDTEENTMYYLIATNKNCQLVTLVLYYEEATPSTPKAVKPTFTGDETFLNSTSVSLSTTTEGASIYYTMGDAPDDPTTTSTLYEGPINVTATTTIKAIAVKAGMDNSPVAEATFTKATIMTVAEAKAAIDAAGSTPIENQYVTGIISQIDGYDGTHHSITYWISADGTTTDQLEVYSGKGLNGADFAGLSDLSLGDEVIVKGTLKNYKGTDEFDMNSQIIQLNRTIAAPTFTPDGGGFLTTLNVALASATEGAEVRYTVDGSDPISTSTLYENPIELSATTTIKAAAFKDEFVSVIVLRTFTKGTKITVAEALAALDSSSPIENQFVYGKVSTAPTSNPNSGRLTYKISDDGAAVDELEVYNGYGLNGAAFADKTDLQVGDEVTIYGTLKIYNEKKEFDGGNYLLEFNRPVIPTYSITYVENGANEDIEDVAAATNLPNPLPTVTKNEKVFGGWFTTSTFDGGTEAVAGAALSDDVILYAKWNDLSPWASVYTSNVTLSTEGGTSASAAKVKFYGEEGDGYDAIKAGTGSVQGAVVVNVPAGATALHFHAYGWNSESVGLTVTAPTGVTVSPATEISINSNSGIASNSPFTLAEGSDPKTDAYYAVSLSGNTEATNITISATSGKRFVLFGVNQEGGVLPILESIEIAGDLTTKSYKAGDALDLDGLTVNAIYSLGGTPQTPVDITDDAELEWSYAPLVENQTSITITATYKGQTDDITINDLVVTSADPKIYVDPSLYVNFGSVDKDAALPADQTITVTLTNVAAGTATLAGADVFNIDKTALVEGENVITISVASTATAGEFSATITLTDNASAAPQKVVNLSFTVNEPVTPEDPEVRKTWDLSIASYDANPTEEQVTWSATYVNMVVDKYNATTKANNYLGGDANNRTSSRFYQNSKLTITPNGKEITSVVFTATSAGYANALQGSEWTNASASVDGTTVTVTPTDGKNAIIAVVGGTCGFTAVQVNYKNIAPEPPVVDYTEVRNGLNIGEFYTMCLDKAVTDVQGGTIWRVVSKAQNTSDIILEEVEGTLDAGRPYIFFATAGKLEVVYTGDAVGAPITEGNNGLVGSFTKKSITANESNYIIYDNELYYVNSGNVYVGDHRAYLNMAAVPAFNSGSAPAPGRRRISMAVHGEQVATGMEGVQPSEISNQKVLINGQLFILRGEKMYDATGRLVK